MHHRLHVITREAQLVSEKERTDKRQLFKIGKGDGILQQLPLRLQGVKLVDELLGVCQEVMVVVLIPVKAKIIINELYNVLTLEHGFQEKRVKCQYKVGNISKTMTRQGNTEMLTNLKLSDLALPGLGTSLAWPKCLAPQLHWTNRQAPAT